jgi:hypothetical protein
MRIRIWDLFGLDPGWKKFASGIRDKHLGSATLPFSEPVCLTRCLGSSIFTYLYLSCKIKYKKNVFCSCPVYLYRYL